MSKTQHSNEHRKFDVTPEQYETISSVPLSALPKAESRSAHTPHCVYDSMNFALYIRNCSPESAQQYKAAPALYESVERLTQAIYNLSEFYQDKTAKKLIESDSFRQARAALALVKRGQ